MAELALNLVALVVAGVVALWTLISLQFVVYEAGTRWAWHRRGLFRDSSLAGTLASSLPGVLIGLGPPAIVLGLLVYFSPSALPWATARWGFWAGVSAAGLFALLVLVGTSRDERRASFYGENRAALKTRLVIRQQSYLRPFQEAWQAAEKKAKDGERVQAAVATAAADVQPQLAFEILDVDRGQQLTSEAPHTAEGGDWTVCTCRALSGAKPAFYFAERSAEPQENAPFAWGEARLWVPSAADGADLAEAIGDAFRVAEGRNRPAGSAAAPPLCFATAVLSRATAPRPEGGFAGAGSWTATKWFYEEAIELYVNWSPEERKGAFAMKDEDYAREVYATFRALVA